MASRWDRSRHRRSRREPTTVSSTGPARPRPGERLAEHEQRIYIPLLLSALLPIVVAASRSATDSRVSIVVNVIAWLVFVYDLFVHIRLERHYLRTKVGVFDLVDRHHHRAMVPAPRLRGLPDPGAGPPGPPGAPVLRQQDGATARAAAGLGGPVLPRHAAVLLVDGLRRRAPCQPRVRHLRRLALVGHRHPDHRRLRRHRARDREGPAGRGLPHADGRRHARRHLGHAGQRLPVVQPRVGGRGRRGPG